MGCSGCGKKRQKFLHKVGLENQRKKKAIKMMVSAPKKQKTLKELRQEKIAARKLRIASRTARIAARTARIAVRNEEARQKKEKENDGS